MLTNSRSRAAAWRARVQDALADRVTVSLLATFVLGAAFYLWTAVTTPNGILGNSTHYYNDLAYAFLHLHLSVGSAPSGLVHLANPYDRIQNDPYQAAYHDLSLYHGRLYLDWGPAPVLVLLVPLRVFGVVPSSNITVALFGIGGLACLLGTLRVLLDEFKSVPLWMGILAAAALVFCTTLPFLLRRPTVYEEAIAGGFFFVMAAVLIAVRAIARRRASLGSLALMSLCFGLAAGSRPPLIATGLLIVPVYLAIAGTKPRRALVAALAGPLGVCVFLLLAYNFARFGNPLEVGQSYQLAGSDPHTMTYGSLSYLMPNLWFYGISPPRPTVLFPFLALTPPPVTYPFGYANTPELTGGLLTMTPLLLFAFALPYLWRRRPQLVGRLAAPLLAAAAAGLFVLVFLSFEFPSSTERYEADFAAVFLLAALAAWFALSSGAPTRLRRAVRIFGAVVALWGCLTGLAISFTGYYDLLHRSHPGTWNTLEDVTSPISTAITMVAGRPILGEAQAPGLTRTSPVHLTTLGAGSVAFSLPVGTPAQLTIVSPDHRQAALVAQVAVGGARPNPGGLSLQVKDASAAPHDFNVLGAGRVRIPITLDRGINRVVLTPLPPVGQLLIVPLLALAGTR